MSPNKYRSALFQYLVNKLKSHSRSSIKFPKQTSPTNIYQQLIYLVGVGQGYPAPLSGELLHRTFRETKTRRRRKETAIS